MEGSKILALVLLALIGVVVGALVLWLIIQYLPFVVAFIIAIFVALVILSFVVSTVFFFSSAVGAVYYAIKKRPKVEGRPTTLREVRKLKKEEGKFEED